MSLGIPLLAVANQTFTVNLGDGGDQWTITIREANGVMAADININGEDVILGTRILAGEPIIPYAYLQNGNLVLTTLNDELPYYTLFGDAQTLVFLTDAEMA